MARIIAHGRAWKRFVMPLSGNSRGAGQVRWRPRGDWGGRSVAVPGHCKRPLWGDARPSPMRVLPSDVAAPGDGRSPIEPLPYIRSGTSNPSTARPDQLDSTLRSVDRIARNNGFDSWIMLNLYPQRTTDPNGLHLRRQSYLHSENLKWIEKSISKPNATIWAAWGTLIDKRPYLKKCLADILDLTKRFPCNWVSIGKRSIKGHPHHPLYIGSSEAPKPFDPYHYLGTLDLY